MDFVGIRATLNQQLSGFNVENSASSRSYPHIAEHREFMDRLSEILLEATEGRIDHEQFSELLVSWLKRHILGSDMQYKAHLVSP